MNNIPGGTSDGVVHTLEDFLKNNRDGFLIYAGTSDTRKKIIY